MADQKVADSTPVLSWRAPEFYFYPKQPSWYVGMLLAAAALVIYFIFSNDHSWITVALIIFAVVALWRNASHKPKNIAIQIRADGVVIDDRFTPYTNLQAFHLTYHHEYTTIDWHKKGWSIPLSALLADQDPATVRSVMGRYLPEKTSETVYINDRISQFFRF